MYSLFDTDRYLHRSEVINLLCASTNLASFYLSIIRLFFQLVKFIHDFQYVVIILDFGYLVVFQ